ncbi:MAG: FAD-dependent oxidoreductase [Bacteroidales bacterium]|nr:FAD-dependent oxidoreductase [Bacteroidales bacterium]
MAKIVVLGAGISGHTAALTLRRALNNSHEVIVVSPNRYYQWVPSNIWVGIGKMTRKNVIFELSKVYKKQKINFKRALGKTIFPEGNAENNKPYVLIEYVEEGKKGETEKVEYDYLVNATGPKLNFAATPGLGLDGYTNSVCSFDHAEHAWDNLQKSLDKMSAGEKQRFVIGVGHPKATCQGAAFEYALNVAFEINKRKLWDKAEIIWLTNEYELGDFGMGGAFVKRGGYVTSTKIFTESILSEYGISWIKRAGVTKVDQKTIHYETLEGEQKTLDYDFAMLIPGFAGAGLNAFNKAGEDITAKIFNPAGFMKVDADYTAKPYEEWKAPDWPSTYQNPDYENVFAAGIAFAPPHAISKQFTNPNGMVIAPAPPRTGMPSGVIGKVIAQNIALSIKKGEITLKHRASMTKMGAACIVSAGYGLRKGSAATLTVFPIVQDYEKYPTWGRNINYTIGEPGLAGHWLKLILHIAFMYKAKAKPFWFMIPE